MLFSSLTDAYATGGAAEACVCATAAVDARLITPARLATHRIRDRMADDKWLRKFDMEFPIVLFFLPPIS
jgi:hypothetical protein